MIFQDEMIARSPRLRRVSFRKKPCISGLNRKVGQNQIQFFGKANGGSFQFFPSMILFRKNHWTKQVFRRGERFLSNLAKVQSIRQLADPFAPPEFLSNSSLYIFRQIVGIVF